jgi:hypothetical protein
VDARLRGTTRDAAARRRGNAAEPGRTWRNRGTRWRRRFQSASAVLRIAASVLARGGAHGSRIRSVERRRARAGPERSARALSRKPDIRSIGRRRTLSHDSTVYGDAGFGWTLREADIERGLRLDAYEVVVVE